MRQPAIERELNGGVQRLYRFRNGFGASVIRHRGSYGWICGEWELAVVKWVPDESPDNTWEGWDIQLRYDTPITENVRGWLNEAEADQLLSDIEQLDMEGGESD